MMAGRVIRKRAGVFNGCALESSGVSVLVPPDLHRWECAERSQGRGSEILPHIRPDQQRLSLGDAFSNNAGITQMRIVSRVYKFRLAKNLFFYLPVSTAWLMVTNCLSPLATRKRSRKAQDGFGCYHERDAVVGNSGFNAGYVVSMSYCTRVNGSAHEG
jgi:hypothetical protein